MITMKEPKIKLRKSDKAILRVLTAGRNVVPNIAEVTGYHPKYLYERIHYLEAVGLITNIGHGVYELVETENEK